MSRFGSYYYTTPVILGALVRQVAPVVAEISAINAELLARRELR